MDQQALKDLLNAAGVATQAIEDVMRTRAALESALKGQADSEASFQAASQTKAIRDQVAADAVIAYSTALSALGVLVPKLQALLPQEVAKP